MSLKAIIWAAFRSQNVSVYLATTST